MTRSSRFGILAYLILSFDLFCAAGTFRFDGIVIQGNTKTKAVVFRDQIPFEVGELLTSDQLMRIPEQVESNLRNLNLFNEVHCLVSILKEDDGVIPWKLYIAVIEKWYLWPIPFLEFADRNVNQWSEFRFDPDRTNYGVYLFQYNLGGMNHTLKWSLIHGYTRMQGVEYQSARIGTQRRVRVSAEFRNSSNTEVWVSTSNNRLNFFASENLRAITRQKAHLGIQYYRSPNKSIYAAGTVGGIRLNDTNVLELNPYFLGDGIGKLKFSMGQLSYTEERRNNRFLPTEGTYLELGSSFSMLRSDEGRLQRVSSVGLRTGAWFKLGSKTSVYGVVRGNVKWSNRPLPYVEARALGYSDYIRGYEYRVIDGHAFGYVRHGVRYHILEDRIPINRMPLSNYRIVNTKILAGLFLDHGYVADSHILNRGDRYENELAGTYLYAYGLSMEGSFYYDKVFRFEISRNASGDAGVSLYFRQAI
ncbi:MAG: hypothetical protein H6606_03650 [Flavobacteriales bacterium]|nr:hypothetical protein [Flavobacteriales bacterium]